jgi:hypothetical protein
MINISKKDNIDAFFQCYKYPKATLYAIDKFFQSYPKSTIYLHCDNGCNYSQIIKKYPNIMYCHNKYQTGTHKMDFLRSIEWIKRLYFTLKQSHKKYFLILEDDVWVNRRVSIKNHSNMVSGPRMTAFFTASQIDHIHKYPNLKHTAKRIYSGAGGCIFEADLIRHQSYNDIVDMIQYYCLRYSLYSDQILSLIIYLGGGTLGFDLYHGRDLTKSDVCHQNPAIKKLYTEPLDDKDKKLISCNSHDNVYDLWSVMFDKNYYND